MTQRRVKSYLNPNQNRARFVCRRHDPAGLPPVRRQDKGALPFVYPPL